ncbi:phage tail protein [Deinococcus hopiensis]|uniref:Microcystin-dependent protein n=1 Tax=Deinococcus hopiensis KR-140 TaxID=695939 RepID=A0A1W1US21_9DEIO|nr:tail fiber protein [Deinococcus hopiensis]SMB83902.1 Microcystin-dependent protein [Deinococcus hopiensis KR-140]
MSNPYIGEIRTVGFNFAPQGWAMCDGQMLPIAEYDTLFALIGTTYGGDGQSTFALPNLQGRIPRHAGQGPGIPENLVLGDTGGTEQVTLTATQLPVHTHTLSVSSQVATDASPAGNRLARSSVGELFLADTPNVSLDPRALSAAGGAQPHENMPPFLTVNYIISLYGIFPQQN